MTIRLYVLYLQGLIPRAKLLLTLGGTFFLAFWPLILVTIAAFLALYLVIDSCDPWFASL
uniref:Tubulin alpha-6 chain n=1 Tax=Solanum tuberosum TaxID=4113 RepID=M1CF12_SOLTU